MGCDIFCARNCSPLKLFQSTHPHGVRQLQVQHRSVGVRVSIHAPTWGATVSALCLQHFPSCFNPRTHMGCDLCLSGRRTRVLRFNPRTHMGCDKPIASHPTPDRFQSTHPHGVRRHAMGDAINQLIKVDNLRNGGRSLDY